MKNAKKLLLLLLSLVLLIGVFAVAAFAEETAEGLTVVYADGKTETFAAGAAVSGRSDVPTDFIQEVDGIAYKFTVAEGAAWSYAEDLPETVTADYYGKTINATIDGELGTAQVYYTTTVGNVTTYVTENNLGTYLKKMDYGVAIKMYADHTTSQKTISGKYSMDTYVGSDGKTYYVAMNTYYKLDLNGHSLTFTGGKITSVASAFYLYSTVPGAELYVTGDSTMFYTNNDDYKYIDGVYCYNDTTQYKNSTLTPNKPTGNITIGEVSEPSNSQKGSYGDNLTIYGQSLTGSLYGNTVRIWGGIFVQTGTQAVFSDFTNRTVPIKHATFVITNPTTTFMRVNATNKAYYSCNIIYAKDGTVPLLTTSGRTITSSDSKNAGDTHTRPTPTFSNCTFYNVIPAQEYTYSYQHTDKKTSPNEVHEGTDIFRPSYATCYFGYSDTATTEDLDAADSTVAYLAYISGGKTVTANNANYLMNMQLITDASKLKTIIWPGNEINYYLATDATEAEAIVKAIPKYQTYLESYEFAGENNTLFYVETPNIVVNVDENLCSVLTDQTVPQQVYLRIEKASGIQYITDASTYQSKLRTILRDTTETQTITLYNDVSFSATYTYGIYANVLKIDLNGYKLTITSNTGGFALDCSSNLYIYSSLPGAVIDAPDATALFRTNDKTTNSVKCYGYIHIGEPDATSTAYGKNLTVYCKQLNETMYSSNGYIYGGTYIQRENSTAPYFVLFSRYNTSGQSHFQAMNNATFIITKERTYPIYWNHASLTFTNCDFINTTDSYIPLMAPMFAAKMSNNGADGNPTFSGCNFYNIIPVKRDSYTLSNGTVKTWVANYNSNCSFGFSGRIPTSDMDVAESTVLYFANVATVVNKEICGETYAMNAKLFTDVSSVLTLDWGVEVDYWEIGSTPYRDAGAGEKVVDGVLFFNPAFDLASVAQIGADGKVTAAGSATVAVVFNDEKTLALSYEDLVLLTTYYVFAEECPDAAALGEKFYELFKAPASAYYVTLYGDLLLASPMGFGEISTGSQPQHQSFAKGAFTLDLNGYTFSVAENIAGIDLSNANSYPAYADVIFAIESGSRNLFTIKSSAPGAQIINPTNRIFIGIGERDTGNIKIEGKNITVTTKGTFIGSVEPEASNVVVIDGGTYIYTGTYTVFSAASRVSVSNATFIYKNAAGCIFATPNYNLDNTVATYENVTVYAAGRTQLYGYTYHNDFRIVSTPARTYTTTVTFKNCTLVNADPSITLNLTTIGFEGTNVFSTDADLEAAYPEAPDGTVPAYYFITYGENTYKVASYLAAADAALINWGFGITEYWKLGETATRDITIVDEIFAYEFAEIPVTADENKATATLVAIYPGALEMSLTLQGQIGVNLLIMPGYLNGATVSVAGKDVAMATKEDVRIASVAISPKDEAVASITFIITMGENEHKVTVGIGAYATAVLNSDMSALAKNLTYSMVEYVRAMNPEANFLAGVELTDGYEYQELTAEKYESDNTSLKAIRFNLAETIEIQVVGNSIADGTDVHLILATTRGERVSMAGNLATFKDLYVNEFYGDMQINVGEETYEYSLANYYAEMTDDYYKAVIEALYNYAYHAQEYVDSITPAAN